ncbi:MAG: DNA-directed RNA polymerase subunit K [Candidatus Methanofastidiosia archaeon]
MVSKYEKARIIGARALQISQGAPTNADGTSCVDIAIKEYKTGNLPIKVTEVVD